jgi:hypothetical protein
MPSSSSSRMLDLRHRKAIHGYGSKAYSPRHRSPVMSAAIPVTALSTASPGPIMVLTPLIGLSPSPGDLPPRATSDLDSSRSPNVVGMHSNSSSGIIDLVNLRHSKEIHGSNSHPRFGSPMTPTPIPWSGMRSGSSSRVVDLVEFRNSKPIHGYGSNSRHHHPRHRSLMMPFPVPFPNPSTARSPGPITMLTPLMGLSPLRGDLLPRGTSDIDSSRSPRMLSSSSSGMVDLRHKKKRKLTETTTVGGFV